MKTKILPTLFILLFFTGCTTTPVSIEKSTSVPDERIYDGFKKYAHEKKSGATIIIVRDRGILGSAGSAAVFLNGEIVARVRTGESLTTYIDSGDNVLGIAPGTKLSHEKDNVELIEQTLNANAGGTYYFRITIDRQKGLILQRTTQVQ